MVAAIGGAAIGGAAIVFAVSVGVVDCCVLFAPELKRGFKYLWSEK